MELKISTYNPSTHGFDHPQSTAPRGRIPKSKNPPAKEGRQNRQNGNSGSSETDQPRQSCSSEHAGKSASGTPTGKHGANTKCSKTGLPQRSSPDGACGEVAGSLPVSSASAPLSNDVLSASGSSQGQKPARATWRDFIVQDPPVVVDEANDAVLEEVDSCRNLAGNSPTTCGEVESDDSCPIDHHDIAMSGGDGAPREWGVDRVNQPSALGFASVADAREHAGKDGQPAQASLALGYTPTLVNPSNNPLCHVGEAACDATSTSGTSGSQASSISLSDTSQHPVAQAARPCEQAGDSHELAALDTGSFPKPLFMLVSYSLGQILFSQPWRPR